MGPHGKWGSPSCQLGLVGAVSRIGESTMENREEEVKGIVKRKVCFLGVPKGRKCCHGIGAHLHAEESLSVDLAEFANLNSQELEVKGMVKQIGTLLRSSKGRKCARLPCKVGGLLHADEGWLVKLEELMN